jgi:hypothetical protein
MTLESLPIFARALNIAALLHYPTTGVDVAALNLLRCAGHRIDCVRSHEVGGFDFGAGAGGVCHRFRFFGVGSGI